MQLTAVGVALLALAMAVLLLVLAVKPPPVAANFTRVGGATRVDTAIEAARFWLQAPAHVYVTAAAAPGRVMLNAARCAMRLDAPVLFRSTAPGRLAKFRALISRWRNDRKRHERLKRLEVISVTRKKPCRPSTLEAKTAGLQTLTGNERLVPDFEPEKPRDELAPVVVFAASKAPQSLADVAVGLALAAHLATHDRKVSLVVVPRHLGADLDLDQQLRERSELVSSGVVVGETEAIAEDTRLVLRQLLRSVDRGGVLDRLRATFGDLGLVIAAILALFVSGAAVTTAAAPTIIQTAQFLWEEAVVQPSDPKPSPKPGPPPRPEPEPQPPPEPGPPPPGDPNTAGPFAVVDSDERPTITVHLRSGRELTGIYHGEQSIGEVPFMKLRAARIWQPESERSSSFEVLLVPVRDIEIAGVELRHDERSSREEPLVT